MEHLGKKGFSSSNRNNKKCGYQNKHYLRFKKQSDKKVFIQKRVRQSCSILPTFFNIVMEEII